MKFTAALIASAVCLGLADAKLHKVGLKKVPVEETIGVCALSSLV
jgi:hypothetical protein